MIRPRLLSLALCSALAVIVVGGCKRPAIRVYTVGRETPAPAAKQEEKEKDHSAGATQSPTVRPQLDYHVPAGWKDVGPSQFSLVNFRISSGDGDAMVNITPLAGMAGRDALIVNMWRQQVGQPPLDDAAAAASLAPVKIGTQDGKLFEVTGTQEGKPVRIVTAFVDGPDGSWFYKLQGNESVVGAQKPAFLDFLKSVKIKPGTAAANADAAPAADAASKTSIIAPDDWEAQPPGQMQLAKFSVKKDGGKADVSVSVFPTDTGGTLANVNRWRRQLELADIDEAGLSECVTPLGKPAIAGAPGAVLADISNNGRRLLGAIVPREGRWWFYKMVGDAPAVGAERDAFVQFVKTQP